MWFFHTLNDYQELRKEVKTVLHFGYSSNNSSGWEGEGKPWASTSSVQVCFLPQELGLTSSLHFPPCRGKGGAQPGSELQVTGQEESQSLSRDSALFPLKENGKHLPSVKLCEELTGDTAVKRETGPWPLGLTCLLASREESCSMSMMMTKSSSTHFLISRPLTCTTRGQQQRVKTLGYRHCCRRGVVAHT